MFNRFIGSSQLLNQIKCKERRSLSDVFLSEQNHSPSGVPMSIIQVPDL